MSKRPLRHLLQGLLRRSPRDAAHGALGAQSGSMRQRFDERREEESREETRAGLKIGLRSSGHSGSRSGSCSSCSRSTSRSTYTNTTVALALALVTSTCKNCLVGMAFVKQLCHRFRNRSRSRRQRPTQPLRGFRVRSGAGSGQLGATRTFKKLQKTTLHYLGISIENPFEGPDI